MILVSEQSTKWYTRNPIAPLWEVPLAKPKKMPDGTVLTMTKATITQGSKIGALPAVSTIKDIPESYQIVQYQREQVALAAYDFPFGGERSEKAMEKYVGMLSAKADEHRKHTADIGKAIHADVQHWLIEGRTPTEMVSVEICRRIDKFFLEQEVTSVTCEESIGSVEKGFAGTPDIVAHTNHLPILADLKTSSDIHKIVPYTSWMLQLAAYKLLLGEEARLLQIIADRDNGDVRFLWHEDLIAGEDPKKWEKAFMHLFNYWCLTNCKMGYDPRTWRG